MFKNRRRPRILRVAPLTLQSKLCLMRIGMAYEAFANGRTKHTAAMALAACRLKMGANQRKPSFGVVVFDLWF